MDDKLKEVVFSRGVVEFVTVCVQYCAYLEEIQDTDKKELTNKLTKMLPLLYLKASLTPRAEIEEDNIVETSVTEDDYNYILSKLTAVFGEDDIYLEVFLEDMKYSDTPISASIGEDLTDIYQDIRNFITIYEHGVAETMAESLNQCVENFKLFWGQKLVNVLRALHNLKYLNEDISTNEDLELQNEGDLW